MQDSLKILNNIRIATPCPASWSKMTGDHRTRFCGECQKNVYNISEMKADDAVALIREKEGKLCLRLYRRQDGTVLTADCPVGLRLLRRGLARMVGSFAAVVTLLIACTAAIPTRWPALRLTRLTDYQPMQKVPACAYSVRNWLEPRDSISNWTGGSYSGGIPDEVRQGMDFVDYIEAQQRTGK